MKLKDRITIEKVGLEEVNATVEEHLLSFIKDCAQVLGEDYQAYGEISSDFASDITLSLSVLDSGNDTIDENLWDTFVYVMSEREWAIVEEVEEEILNKVVRLWEQFELSSNQVSFTIIEYAKRFSELNDIVVEMEEEHEENGYLEIDGFSNAIRFVEDMEYLKMLENLYIKGDN